MRLSEIQTGKGGEAFRAAAVELLIFVFSELERCAPPLDYD